jgi:CelD/BcsL family acetyltransferase involved in cellulose biosynthesis
MIKIIDDPNQVESMHDEWNRLADRFQTPLLRNEWFSALAQAYYHPGQLHIIVYHTERGIDAIAPLALVKHRGITRLEILGGSFLFEPTGLLYKDELALQKLIDNISKQDKSIILNRLYNNSQEIEAVRKLKSNQFQTQLNQNGGAPYLPITTDWDTFEKSLSSRTRYDLRRAKKRADSLGTVSFETITPTPETFHTYLEKFFEVEAANWKGKQGSAILNNTQMKKFFTLYCQKTAELNTLTFYFLKINEHTAGALITVEYFNRRWVLKIGYNEQFAHCSPGILLIHESLRQSFEQNLSGYEFLGYDAPWIHQWTKQLRDYVSAKIYPRSVNGSIGLGIDTSIDFAKKLFKMTGIINNA